LTFLTGQLMRLTRGRANPATSRDLLVRELSVQDEQPSS